MSQEPNKDLPQDEHLREDIGAPTAEPDSAAEFDDDTFTSGLTNTGQRVPGLSPGGEYKASADPEHEDDPGQDGFQPPETGAEG